MQLLLLLLSLALHGCVFKERWAQWEWAQWDCRAWFSAPRARSPEEQRFLRKVQASHMKLLVDFAAWSSLAGMGFVANHCWVSDPDSAWGSLFAYLVFLHWAMLFIRLVQKEWSAAQVKSVIWLLHGIFLIRNNLNNHPHRWFLNCNVRAMECMLLSAVQLDWRESIFLLLAHAVHNVRKSMDLCTRHEVMSEVSLGAFVYSEGMTCMLVFAVSFVLEVITKERLEAIMQAKSSGVEKTAVVRLLRAFSDATVQLGADLCIRGPHRRFCQLMMLNSSGSDGLQGVQFSNYLSESDKPRFAQFIDRVSPNYEEMEETSAESSPASSLHVHMHDSCGLSFQVELFHACFMSLDGSLSHIIGICEEGSEARQQAKEPCSDQQSQERNPSAAPAAQFLPLRPSSVGSSRSSSHSSTGSARALPDIERVSLVFDPFEARYPVNSCTCDFSSDGSEKRLPCLLDLIETGKRERLKELIFKGVNEAVAGTAKGRETLQLHQLALKLPGVNRSLLAQKVVLAVEQGSAEADSEGSEGSGEELEVSLELQGLSLVKGKRAKLVPISE